jgi:hypothetical protein
MTTTSLNESENRIPTVTTSFDVIETIVIVRKRRQHQNVPVGWNPLRILEQTKEYIRRHTKDLIWDVLEEKRTYHYFPVGTDHERASNAEPSLKAIDALDERSFVYPLGTRGRNGHGHGNPGGHNADRLGFLVQPAYQNGGYGPASADTRNSCGDPESWPDHATRHTGNADAKGLDQALSDPGFHLLPGDGAEVQEPQAPRSEAGDDTGRVPAEMGAAERLPNGGSELRSGTLRAGEEDGPGATAACGISSSGG